MKITKISYQKSYIIGPYLQEKVGFEAEISEPYESELGGTYHIETPQEVLSHLRELADEWHKATNPPEIVAAVDMRTNGNLPPTIDIEKSDPSEYLALIQNAPDMAALTSFKLIASSEKTLYNAYCQRLKKLAHE